MFFLGNSPPTFTHQKLVELCPGVEQGKRPRHQESYSSSIDAAAMDAHLDALAETVEELEGLSGAFVSAHRERGRALAYRLTAIFSSPEK
ncbi:unnamed protein product [Hydatigera taeniaeformis]|uniref:Uncharacterized protein n=1 Tax=Hydatigena taeniaeformis TaxID=6205 RepID=A0A0R3XCT3_HYDTA|nr:unnamed protein product [Hydatigera taeniaeformis]